MVRWRSSSPSDQAPTSPFGWSIVEGGGRRSDSRAMSEVRRESGMLDTDTSGALTGRWSNSFAIVTKGAKDRRIHGGLFLLAIPMQLMLITIPRRVGPA